MVEKFINYNFYFSRKFEKKKFGIIFSSKVCDGKVRLKLQIAELQLWFLQNFLRQESSWVGKFNCSAIRQSLKVCWRKFFSSPIKFRGTTLIFLSTSTKVWKHRLIKYSLSQQSLWREHLARNVCTRRQWIFQPTYKKFAMRKFPSSPPKVCEEVSTCGQYNIFEFDFTFSKHFSCVPTRKVWKFGWENLLRFRLLSKFGENVWQEFGKKYLREFAMDNREFGFPSVCADEKFESLVNKTILFLRQKFTTNTGKYLRRNSHSVDKSLRRGFSPTRQTAVPTLPYADKSSRQEKFHNLWVCVRRQIFSDSAMTFRDWKIPRLVEEVFSSWW